MPIHPLADSGLVQGGTGVLASWGVQAGILATWVFAGLHSSVPEPSRPPGLDSGFLGRSSKDSGYLGPSRVGIFVPGAFLGWILASWGVQAWIMASSSLEGWILTSWGSLGLAAKALIFATGELCMASWFTPGFDFGFLGPTRIGFLLPGASKHGFCFLGPSASCFWHPRAFAGWVGRLTCPVFGSVLRSVSFTVSFQTYCIVSLHVALYGSFYTSFCFTVWGPADVTWSSLPRAVPAHMKLERMLCTAREVTRLGGQQHIPRRHAKIIVSHNASSALCGLGMMAVNMVVGQTNV